MVWCGFSDSVVLAVWLPGVSSAGSDVVYEVLFFDGVDCRSTDEISFLVLRSTNKSFADKKSAPNIGLWMLAITKVQRARRAIEGEVEGTDSIC